MGGYRIKKTKEQFIEEAKKIHGDKYDYSKVNYVNSKTKVCIVCKKHGEFWQEAGGHLKGYGCDKCYQEERKMRRLVSGVGINDYNGVISVDGKELKSYQTWRNMIARCYCKNTRSRYKTYEKCDVTEEWKYFTKFKSWFDEHYIEGFDLDKDLLVPKNKTYSPETCVFIPHQINTLFREIGRAKNCEMAGVAFSRKGGAKIYRAVARIDGVSKNLGLYKTEEEAHKAYLETKYKEAKRLADKHYRKGDINEKVYNAILNYRIA